MEILDKSVPRAKLIIGQYPIISVTPRLYVPGINIRVRFHEVSFTMTTKEDIYDVRMGDWCWLYTDLPLKQVKDALALPTPVQ